MRMRMLASCIMLAAAAAASAQSAEEVARRAALFGDARWLTMAVDMDLRGPSGVRQRGLEVFISRGAEEVRILVRMVSPAFLSQMKFLTHRGPKGEASSWLRTSQGVRKLSRANAGERLFDSDFTVEDFTEVEVADFTAVLLADATIEGVPCSAVQLTPRFRSQYARKVMFVPREGGGLQGIDYYDGKDALVRQYRLLETRTVDGAPFPSVSVMRDLSAGSETRLTVRELDAATPLPDRTFNKGNL